MDRAEWLKKMRAQSEALYDHLAPAYWVTFGFYPNEAHREFIAKFLARLTPASTILDAGCGAGRYDAPLLEAGHTVLGIDQSARMLARAREIYPEEGFPGLRYAKMGLQEIDFRDAFDGLICVDALEHVSPEDWPGIMIRFHEALRPGGVLYLTLDDADSGEVTTAYERARAQGLPVVFGEVVDRIDEAYGQVSGQDWQSISGQQSDVAVYHYHPGLKQARAWIEQAGFAIEEEGIGSGYAHILARKKAN